MKKKQLIISVGREFGSGGHEIAQGLADHYGLTMYDHDLLKEIAAKKNLNGDELTAYDEVKWNRFLYRTVRGLNSSPEQNVANLQFEYLREKAKAGDSFVVVGRCSETILREYKCLVSIFVGGDISKKAERVMNRILGTAHGRPRPDRETGVHAHHPLQRRGTDAATQRHPRSLEDRSRNPRLRI